MSDCGHLVCAFHGCHLEACLEWHIALVRLGGRISLEAPV